MDITADALSAYELFNCLRTTTNREQYKSAFSDYNHFFKLVNPSVFFTLILSLYKLLETRRDTVNLGRVVDQANKNGYLDATEQRTLQMQITQARTIWNKVRVVRNELIAHCNQTSSLTEVFAKANVTPRELEELAIAYIDILNFVAAKCGMEQLNSNHLIVALNKQTGALLSKLSC